MTFLCSFNKGSIAKIDEFSLEKDVNKHPKHELFVPLYTYPGINQENSRAAFERALELLCLSICDSKHGPSTLKELCRVREFLTDYFLFNNEYKSDDTFFEKYFYYFSYRAAAERGL